MTNQPRTVRSPVRPVAPPEREPVRAKVRVRKGMGVDQLHIPQEMIPDGVDLQWVTDSVLGQPNPHGRQQFEINAWEPVLPSMFEGRFDGMFMPKGYKGEINVGGLVLMWRPMELTLEARAEERQAARHAMVSEEAKMKTGQVEGITFDTDTPNARAHTFVKKTREPMPI